MGKVVRFPRRHVRALSNPVGRRAAKSAKTSSEISGRPVSDARRTTAAQRELGIPRPRQPLTVETDCDRAPATPLVPPRASMTESHVHESSMVGDLVRNLRTCQAFATCETTFRDVRGQISTMDSAHDIARRLIAFRESRGLNQVDFAEKLDIAKNTLNGYEKATRPLTTETIRRIRKRFGISTDWLLFGDIGQPSHDLALEFGPRPAIEADTKKPKKKVRARKVS
jgi:transcriptional regulator with XRE-family HTH domain